MLCQKAGIEGLLGQFWNFVYEVFHFYRERVQRIYIGFFIFSLITAINLLFFKEIDIHTFSLLSMSFIILHST